MEDTKRLGIPLLLILFSALAVKLIHRFFTFSFTPTLITFLIVCSLFLFGMVLNKSRKRRNPAVFKGSGNSCYGTVDADADGIFYFTVYEGRI